MNKKTLLLDDKTIERLNKYSFTRFGVTNMSKAIRDICEKPFMRGEQARTKEIEVPMKGNLAFWALDASIDCLYGYVAGKVDEAFFMEEDKFEAVYELSWAISQEIAPWFAKDSNIDIDNEVKSVIETENFIIKTWYLSGLNDFSAYIERR